MYLQNEDMLVHLIPKTSKTSQDPPWLCFSAKKPAMQTAPINTTITAINILLITDFSSIWHSPFFSPILHDLIKHFSAERTGNCAKILASN